MPETEIVLSCHIDPFTVWDARAKIPGLRSVTSIAFDEVTAESESERLVWDVFAFLGDSIDGKDVYEIGPGVGRFTAELARRSRCVTAMDISHGMLQRTRENVGGSNNIYLVQGSASNTVFGPGSFDWVFEVTTLIHMPDEHFERIIDQARQGLRPGGKIFLCGPMAEESPKKLHEYLFHRTRKQYENALAPFSILREGEAPCGNQIYRMYIAGLE